MENSVIVRGIRVGENAPALIIAEVASSHEGDFEDLIKLIEFASKTGAGAVKFQVLTADSHMTSTHQIWDLVQKLEFSSQEWREAIDYTRANTDLLVITDVYDIGSVEKVKNLHPDMVKIHSADLGNLPLIQAVADLNVPTLFGVGASTIEEIVTALRMYRSRASKTFMALMHGYQGFPTDISDMNMLQMRMLRDRFGIPVGFLDHTEGDTDESIYLSLVARGLGAFAIEKHIVLDRQLKGIDHEAAISMDVFRKLVSQLRVVEQALGSFDPVPFSDGENKYRQFMKKNIVAAIDIRKGEIVNLDSLAFKRTGASRSTGNLKAILGKEARTDIKKNQTITGDMLR